MTTSERQARPVQVGTPPGYRKGSLLADWLSTTDHKIIGHLYLITSFGFFLVGGIMAMIMRAQLMGPNNHIVSDQVYNELFTMHGTIMLLLFAPAVRGFAPTGGGGERGGQSQPGGGVRGRGDREGRGPQLPRRTANPTRTGDPEVRILFTPH